MQTPHHNSQLTDAALLQEVRELTQTENRNLSLFLERLAEIDARKLYAQMGYPSLFAFLIQDLKFSEDAAYKRIQAARALSRFPRIGSLLAEGRVHLTAVTLLAPVLTEENHQRVLAQASGKTKLEIERLRSQWAPQPDAPDLVRRLPVSSIQKVDAPAQPTGSGTSWHREERDGSREGPANEIFKISFSGPREEPGALLPECHGEGGTAEASPRAPSGEGHALRARHDRLTPLSAERIKFQFTGSEALRKKLQRARELLRHKYPSGQLEDIFDEALEALLDKKDPERQLARKTSRRDQITTEKTSDAKPSRYIPQAVKDKVWSRDHGCCQYVSPDGARCQERGGLEYDHIRPWALNGSSTDPANIRLLCRTHNQWRVGRVEPAG